MSVRITARCSFCTRTFTPPRDEDTGSPLVEDTGGRITCELCECEYCGHGHAIEVDRAACLAEREALRAEHQLQFAH